MTLIEYWKNLAPEAKKAFAEKLETSPAYLSQVANGHRNGSPAFAIAIERETGGAVTRAEIRPDIFGVDTFSERRAVSNA